MLPLAAASLAPALRAQLGQFLVFSLASPLWVQLPRHVCVDVQLLAPSGRVWRECLIVVLVTIGVVFAYLTHWVVLSHVADITFPRLLPGVALLVVAAANSYTHVARRHRNECMHACVLAPQGCAG